MQPRPALRGHWLSGVLLLGDRSLWRRRLFGRQLVQGGNLHRASAGFVCKHDPQVGCPALPTAAMARQQGRGRPACSMRPISAAHLVQWPPPCLQR